MGRKRLLRRRGRQEALAHRAEEGRDAEEFTRQLDELQQSALRPPATRESVKAEAGKARGRAREGSRA